MPDDKPLEDRCISEEGALFQLHGTEENYCGISKGMTSAEVWAYIKKHTCPYLRLPTIIIKDPHIKPGCYAKCAYYKK